MVSRKRDPWIYTKKLWSLSTTEIIICGTDPWVFFWLPFHCRIFVVCVGCCFRTSYSFLFMAMLLFKSHQNCNGYSSERLFFLYLTPRNVVPSIRYKKYSPKIFCKNGFAMVCRPFLFNLYGDYFRSHRLITTHDFKNMCVIDQLPIFLLFYLYIFLNHLQGTLIPKYWSCDFFDYSNSHDWKEVEISL